MTLTEISIKRPSLIIVIFTVLILGGLFSYRQLSYELMPPFSIPTLIISTPYPGASPTDVNQTVTKEIEDAVTGLSELRNISSQSYEGVSVVIAEFETGADMDKKQQEAQRIFNNIMAYFPDGVKTPIVNKISQSDAPIMKITAVSKMGDKEFFDLMDKEVVPIIKQIDGISNVWVVGGQEREIKVNVDRNKLASYGIPLSLVTQIVNSANLDFPTGKVKNTSDQITVRLAGRFSSVDQIRNLVIASTPTGNVRLSDVADVVDGLKEQQSISRFNGLDGIGLVITKQSDANAVEICNKIKERVAAVEKNYAKSGVQFTIAEDSSDITLESVDAVTHDLMIAVILVALVILVFLHSIRDSFIVLVAIPTSIVSTFIAMYFFGYSLNLMTLLAMSLVIGILVDDSIVVLENIHRHFSMGKSKREAALDGRNEIGFAALAITMVDVVVFLPILFLQVFVADMLMQFSVIVITSTLTSLLVGFTLTPWLASRIGKKEELQPTNFFNRFLLCFEVQLQKFIEWYGVKLKWVLSHKLIFGAIVIVLLALTGVMMKQGIIGKELMSTGDQGKFRMNLEYDKTTTVQQNNLISQQIENFIIQQPEVASLFSNVAGPSTGIGSLGVGSANKTEFTIQLKPENERDISTEKYMKSLREALKKEFPSINYSMAVLGLLPKSAPIKITLSGSNLDLVMKTGAELKAMIEQIPGADNVQLSVEEGVPEYKVIPDKDKMQRLGLTTAYVGMNLRTAFTGNDDATLTEKGIEYPVRIWLDDFSRKNYEDVQHLTIVNSMNQPIEVSQFADVKQDNSPSLLERMDRQASVTLTAESFGRPSGTLADEAITQLKNKPLPEGVKMSWGADIKTQNESFGALGSVLLISFLLIYLIMVALYDNYIYPFVALFGIPVAAIGAFLALNLSLNDLTLFAQLGLIMLMGLVTKNSILIVDFTNQLKAEGKHFKEALLIAGKERMRPILMTTLAMAIGMLPIALAKGTAAE